MVDWLDDASDADTTFVKALRSTFLTAPASLTFRPCQNIRFDLPTALRFQRECWLNDTAVNSLLHVVLNKLNSQGDYLMVTTYQYELLRKYLTQQDPVSTSLTSPPHHLSLERVHTMQAAAEESRNRGYNKDVKAFGIINVNNNNWAVSCIDFVQQQISLGHSLNRGKVERYLGVWITITTWLKSGNIDLNSWPKQLSRFPVSQQPVSSGSCGVIACNAIEHHLDNTVVSWTPARNADVQTTF
ncbi:hypothetical protein BG011_001047 [Mortierella polycephala]|uniref:Ubiquitin-like protease family profile domain-containing protein n=1 Tax=Mortierella polycephala TaxID=41804 RepID=A0A9P6TV00_9FUNG|nr:hypothetical protein BG011_001047 [Mortierella polycephala]